MNGTRNPSGNKSWDEPGTEHQTQPIAAKALGGGSRGSHFCEGGFFWRGRQLALNLAGAVFYLHASPCQVSTRRNLFYRFGLTWHSCECQVVPGGRGGLRLTHLTPPDTS
jgi:hypothetical protein